MSMMVSFMLSFFPRDVLDEILNLIESVSEDFLTTLGALFVKCFFLSVFLSLMEYCWRAIFLFVYIFQLTAARIARD